MEKTKHRKEIRKKERDPEPHLSYLSVIFPFLKDTIERQ
jgi:hypothetical protein